MSLKSLVEGVSKKYEKSNPDFLLDVNRTYNTISTGSVILDGLVGKGLLVEGKINEIFGLEGCGKTTVCLMSCAEALKKGKSVLYIDSEQGFDVKYARALGIDPESENFTIVRPSNFEQAVGLLQELESAVSKGGVNIDVIIIDSIAMLKPKELLEKAGEQAAIGLHARKIGELFNYLLSHWCIERRCAILATNQLRRAPSMGGMFQAKAVQGTGIGAGAVNADLSWTTTGGQQINYIFSIRVFMEHGSKIEVGNYADKTLKRIGNYIKVNVVKNRLCEPYKKANLAVIYGKGIDDSYTLFDALKTSNNIISSGGNFTFVDSKGSDPISITVPKGDDLSEVKSQIDTMIKNYESEDGGLSFKIRGKDLFESILKNNQVLLSEMKSIYESVMASDTTSFTDIEKKLWNTSGDEDFEEICLDSFEDDEEQ